MQTISHKNYSAHFINSSGMDIYPYLFLAHNDYDAKTNVHMFTLGRRFKTGLIVHIRDHHNVLVARGTTIELGVRWDIRHSNNPFDGTA